MNRLPIIFILLLAGCSLPHSAQFQPTNTTATEIINGSTPAQNSPEALSTVALYLPIIAGASPFQNPITNFCTATLIGPNVVLTAAHCIVDLADKIKTTPEVVAKEIIVGFGSKVVNDLTSPDFQYRNVLSFKVHPQYSLSAVQTARTQPMYDVALLKLDSNAPASAQPAQIMTSTAVLKKGLPLLLVGFGLTNSNPQIRATQMLETTVTVDNPAMTTTQFTYVNPKAGSCNGDSGGPAYVRLDNGSISVLGITSWGDRDCKIMGAYTSVPAMKDWIWSTIPTL